MLNKTAQKGVYLALLTAFISGISIFINKFAVGSVTPPLFFTAFKNFGVALFIVSLVLFSGKFKKLKNLSKKEITMLVLIGIVGGSVPFYLYFTGLSMIPAINSAIIHKTLVFWVAILAVPLLKEKVTKWQGIGILILFLSNLIIGGFKGLGFSFGEFLTLLATILWAVENIIAKKVLKTVDPDVVVLARMGLGSLLLITTSYILVPASFSQVFSLGSAQWMWLGVTAVSLLAYTMSWYRALKHAPAVLVAAVLVSSTLVTNVLSAIFITKVWNTGLSLQSLLMIVGTIIFVSQLLLNKKSDLAKIEN